jgi:hypothetical protein
MRLDISGPWHVGWPWTERRTSPLPAKDPVTPRLYQLVMERDQRCLAPVLDSSLSEKSCRAPLTLDHVQEQYGRMGKRASSDYFHLVTLCAHHHLDGWATSHRPLLRAYLEACQTMIVMLNGEGTSIDPLVLQALRKQ